MRKYREKDRDHEATFSRTKRTLPSGARKVAATSNAIPQMIRSLSYTL